MNYIIEPNWIYWINVLPNIELMLWILLVAGVAAFFVMLATFGYDYDGGVFDCQRYTRIDGDVNRIKRTLNDTVNKLKLMNHCLAKEEYRGTCTRYIEEQLESIEEYQKSIKDYSAEKMSLKRWLIAIGIVEVIIVLALIFLPSKETMIEMFVAKNITSANLQLGKDVIIDTVKEIMEAINGGLK